MSKRKSRRNKKQSQRIERVSERLGKADDAEKADDKPAEKADDKKADDKPAEKADDKPAEKADDKKADDKPAEKADDKPAEKADDKKADDKPAEKADDKKADDEPAEKADDETKSDEPPPPAAPTPTPKPRKEPQLLGMLAEFEKAEGLLIAAGKCRDKGFSDWDCHTPYPLHGLDKAMGIKPTILPWIVFGGGLTGCLTGFALQLYTNGIELPFSFLQSDNSILRVLLSPFLPSGYPYVVSGKPIFSVPANIPVIFELTILLSAFGAFFGMLALNKLPTFFHPVFTSQRFRRATSDRFFISVLADDPRFHRQETRAFLESLGAANVEELLLEEEG